MNYYNEFDPKAAAWLRELIAQNLIPPGTVDTRSITDVLPTDLSGFTQCHFFAGIGGWSLALRLAGWPDDQPVWTGSAPCQPFSSAGKGLGNADERHLWPVFFNLIRECRPECVFGEQVASAIGKGWLDGIRTDLEGENYACGAVVLGAHSAGAPHIRQRLFWVADTQGEGWAGVESELQAGLCERPRAGRDCADGRLADPSSARCFGAERHAEGEARHEARMQLLGANGETGGPADANSNGFNQGRRSESAAWNDGAFRDGRACGLEHAESERRQQRRAESSGRGAECGCGVGGVGNAMPAGPQGSEPQDLRGARRREEGRTVGESGCPSGAWSNFDLIPCRDGKARRVERGLEPLVNGLPKGVVRSGNCGQPIDADATPEARVMRLRGYGNAIIPQLAAEFIGAYLET